MDIFKIEPHYEVQIINKGESITIISRARKIPRVLKMGLTNTGYYYFNINCEETAVHTIVSYFYHGEMPRGLVVNHIDGNKKNNKAENLEYITQSENAKHAYRTGLHYLANNPTKSPTYIDGRSRDKKKYHTEFYLRNKEIIKERSRKRHEEKREEINAKRRASRALAKLSRIDTTS